VRDKHIREVSAHQPHRPVNNGIVDDIVHTLYIATSQHFLQPERYGGRGLVTASRDAGGGHPAGLGD